MPSLRVAVIAEQGEAEALAPTRRVLWIVGGVAVVAAALAILAGFGLTRRIVRPLAQLSDAAGRIADGELDLRATVVREDEVGNLAHAFNRMTGQLSALVGNLQRRTERLRAIDETSRQISSILELEELRLRGSIHPRDLRVRWCASFISPNVAAVGWSPARARPADLRSVSWPKRSILRGAAATRGDGGAVTGRARPGRDSDRRTD
jgi:HAMP domain-containing protein